MFYVLFVYANGTTLMVERELMSDAMFLYDHGADDPNVTFTQLGGAVFGPVFKAQEGAALKAFNSSEIVDTGRGDDTVSEPCEHDYPRGGLGNPSGPCRKCGHDPLTEQRAFERSMRDISSAPL